MKEYKNNNLAAVVVGGSRGIGFDIAKKLYKEGYIVYIIGSNQDNLEKAESIAKKQMVMLKTVKANVTNEKQVIDAFESIVKECVPKVFVNCVGKNLSQRFVAKTNYDILTHGFEEWKNTIDINLNSTFLCCREESKILLSNNSDGVIINISTALWTGGFGQSAYTSAKAGVVALTKTIAYELAKYNIRVVCIAPGAINGEALYVACEKNEKHKKYMEMLREQIPLQRFVSENDVSQAVLFAIKTDSLTGNVIQIDGGGVPAKVIYAKR